MKYKPERDIPKAIRTLKTLSPTDIVEWIRENRTEIDNIGRKVQKNLKPQAINMWFKRHPDEHKQLAREIADAELNGKVITEGVFQTKIFIKLPCMEKWIIKMRGRQAKERSIGAFVGAIRQVCMGRLPRKKGQKEVEHIEDWGLKHPRRLTVEDGQRYISKLMEKKIPTRNHRLALRNFFKSRNLEGWDDISGKLETEAGKYAYLYVPPETIQLILQYIKGLNPVAYRACKFALKTACRMGGVQSAHTNKLNKEDHTIWVLEKATRGKPKRSQEKFISQDLWEELGLKDYKGKLFDIEPQQLNNICKTAYQAIIPTLAPEIPMPFHFWRHQFAQHGLRRTQWNYALIAGLGHWTVETLERYYGKMDRQTRLQGARTFVHLIGMVVEEAQEVEIMQASQPSQPINLNQQLPKQEAKAGWNYANVADLSNGTMQAVEPYYTDMDRETLLQGAKTFVHLL